MTVFLVLLVALPACAALAVRLPRPATMALAVEQCRLLMKAVSYLRENAKAVLAGSDTNTAVGHMIYFLFAPTLIYRPSYRRYSETQ